MKRNPKIRGFVLEVVDQEAFYQVWKSRVYGNKPVNGFYLASHVEFGASPMRDKRSMDRFLSDMKSIGLEYIVYPII